MWRAFLTGTVHEVASILNRADRVLFLGDGRIVDEMVDPDADAIFDRIRELGG